MKRTLSRAFKILGILAALAVLAGATAILLTGRMVDRDDEPAPAGAIVVLGGGHFRPLHAADLYHRGLAPEIWLSRVPPRRDLRLLAEAGVDLPPQHEINRRLLVARGVPDHAVRLYGRSLASTRDEARAFARECPDAQRIIVVTSPYHVPRARLIFSNALPGTEVLVVGTPYEPFPARWWTQRDSAVRVVNETAKLIWYIAGGCFENERPAGEPAGDTACGPDGEPSDSGG